MTNRIQENRGGVKQNAQLKSNNIISNRPGFTPKQHKSKIKLLPAGNVVKYRIAILRCASLVKDVEGL